MKFDIAVIMTIKLDESQMKAIQTLLENIGKADDFQKLIKESTTTNTVEPKKE